jgi:hypothetical protein
VGKFLTDLEVDPEDVRNYHCNWFTAIRSGNRMKPKPLADSLFSCRSSFSLWPGT